MNKQVQTKLKYEEEQIYKPFDVINKDLDLLLLLIFLEAYKEGKDELRMTDLMKGNYWDHDDIRSEVLDTNDFWSIEDMVLGQIEFLVEDQRLGNLVGLKIENPTDALRDAIYSAIKLDSTASKDDIGAIMGAVEQITFLEYQDRDHKHKMLEQDPRPENIREVLMDKTIFIGKDKKYIEAVQAIAIVVPEHITLKFAFDERGIEKFEVEVKQYIDKFRNDEFQEELPRYQEKRLYFVQQIENFYRYISKLDLIGDTLNIPFSILAERGFEAVKILKYLELKGLIQFRWSDQGSWKVKFNEIPITPNSLLGVKTDKAQGGSSKLKFDLSFTPQTGILVFKNGDVEYKVKIQGQVQKEVLRVIFQNPVNVYTEWSLYDISEALGAQDASTTSVKNAIYQLNKKVKLEIPEIEKLFEGDQHSVILNEKYIEKK
jgi:hypothetical protein